MKDFFGGRATPRLAIGLTACVVVLMATASNAQNLLVNGSFETGNFTGVNPPNAADTTDLAPGSTNITGWTTLSGGSDIAWESTGNPYNFLATDGARSLDLTGYTDSAPYGGVTQTLTLTAGNKYTLSFDISSQQDMFTDVGPIGIQATVGSLNQLFTFTPTKGSTGFQFGTETATFTATSAITTLTLQGASTAGGHYIGLDNAKIIANASAPEPASLLLASAATLPFLGALRRRRVAR